VSCGSLAGAAWWPVWWQLVCQQASRWCPSGMWQSCGPVGQRPGGAVAWQADGWQPDGNAGQEPGRLAGPVGQRPGGLVASQASRKQSCGPAGQRPRGGGHWAIYSFSVS
jgi:hypothetical protein